MNNLSFVGGIVTEPSRQSGCLLVGIIRNGVHLRSEALEAYFANISVIILCDKKITIISHGNLARLADFETWRVEMLPISSMRRGLSINEEVNDPRRINIPDLTAFMGGEQVTSVRKEPNSTHSPESCLKRGKTVAAAGLIPVAGNNAAVA